MRATAASVLLLGGLVVGGGAGSFQQAANAQNAAPPAATLRLSVNVRKSIFSELFFELACQEPNSPVGTYRSFLTPASVDQLVTPNTVCRLNMIPGAAARTRTLRTSFRSVVDGVSKVLPSYLGDYFIPVGAAGTVTNAQFDFDFDVANPLDLGLDLFERGGSQPWTSWFGSPTVVADTYFSGAYGSLSVRATSGFRAAKRVLWVAGYDPKFELYLRMINFAGTATVQYFDANSRKLSEQLLTLTPSSVGSGPAPTFILSTITKPAKTAFILIGLSSQVDFGVDAFRLTRVPATVPATTLPPTTTTSSTVAPTSTVPPSTTVVPTTAPSTTTAPPTTGVPTTVPGTLRLVFPASVVIGAPITFSVTGISPANGRVDFSVGGGALGSALVTSDGTASIVNSLWSSGKLTVEANLVQYVAGVQSTVKLAGTITVL